MKHLSDQMCDWKKNDTKRKETKKTDRYKKTIDCVLLMSCLFTQTSRKAKKVNTLKHQTLYVTFRIRFKTEIYILYFQRLTNIYHKDFLNIDFSYFLNQFSDLNFQNEYEWNRIRIIDWTWYSNVNSSKNPFTCLWM